MLNAEKYRDKLLKFIEKGDVWSFTFSKGEEGKFWQCGSRCCSECGMSKERSNCTLERLKWLLAEYKEPVRLTKLEYDILKYISDNTKYLYITRDRCDGLFLYGMEPSKGDGYWNGKSYVGMTAFNKLFQFVKWEDKEATSIKNILENCEVIEDANY